MHVPWLWHGEDWQSPMAESEISNVLPEPPEMTSQFSPSRVGPNYKKILLENCEFLPKIFLTSSTKHIGKENIIGYINNLNKQLKSNK